MPAANVVLPISVRTTTTNGTATTGATFQTQSNHLYLIEARIVATDGATASAAYGLVGLFENSLGTLTQVGSTGTLWTAIEEIANPMTAAFVLSGTIVQVSVTGDPGRTVRWNIDLNIREIVTPIATS